MKQVIIWMIIVATLLLAALLYKLLQRWIRPRQSLQRMLLLMVATFLLTLLLTFGMVLLIVRLYPGELMK